MHKSMNAAQPVAPRFLLRSHGRTSRRNSVAGVDSDIAVASHRALFIFTPHGDLEHLQ
jgi:hypothetical protein